MNTNNDICWMHLGDCKYYGELLNGVPHGKGKLVLPDCRTYDGEFANGQFSGCGSMTWPSGQRYEGLWDNNNPEGKGIMYYANGNVYEGFFHKGLRHGVGTLRMPDGSYIYGAFIEDKPAENGTYFDAKKNRTFKVCQLHEPSKHSVLQVIWRKTWRLWMALLCFGLAIVTGCLVADFLSGNGGSFIRVKGLVAPLLFAICGIVSFADFITHLFKKDDE